MTATECQEQAPNGADEEDQPTDDARDADDGQGGIHADHRPSNGPRRHGWRASPIIRLAPTPSSNDPDTTHGTGSVPTANGWTARLRVLRLPSVLRPVVEIGTVRLNVCTTIT